MATIHPRQNPDQPVLIEAVAAGDQLDFETILGRAAERIVMFTTDSGDTVNYRVNSLMRTYGTVGARSTELTLKRWGVLDLKETWIPTSIFDSTGLQIELFEDMPVSSLEIVSLTLSVGATIEIVAY